MISVDANQAWLNLLNEIIYKGQLAHPRNLKIKELLCKTTVTNMTQPVVSIKRRKMGYRFMAAEAWWILTGRNDLATIKPYSPHIGAFSNDGFFFDGAYGPAIVEQLRYIVDSIVEDIDTRQAVIGIWRPNPRPSKDHRCTLSQQFLVREGKLHCIDTMRSSDAWLGWVYDVFNFSMLSAYILLLLRQRSVFFNNIELGNLYLTAGSSHLYVNAKEDGASHVPYTIDDVEKILTEWRENPLVDQFKSYLPLNIDEFTSPQSLIDHLDKCKDKLGELPFLKEFQQ